MQHNCKMPKMFKETGAYPEEFHDAQSGEVVGWGYMISIFDKYIPLYYCCLCGEKLFELFDETKEPYFADIP